jgi:hypothetical protein
LTEEVTELSARGLERKGKHFISSESANERSGDDQFLFKKSEIQSRRKVRETDRKRERQTKIDTERETEIERERGS